MSPVLDQVDSKDVEAIKELFNLKIEYVIKDQKDFFEQKEKNEKWRAVILSIIFGPLLAWNGWIQVQTKKEVMNLSDNIVDYVEWKAEQKALNKEFEREIDKLKDIVNECRISHGLTKYQ